MPVMSNGDLTTRAEAIVTVHKYEPVVYEQPDEGPALSRIHIDESFSGDINGDIVFEVLQSTLADGSASFTGIGRVTGTVADRRGTFLLEVQGGAARRMVTAEWFVMPGSGTGQLIGLRGQGGFHGTLGESSQAYIDYWFE